MDYNYPRPISKCIIIESESDSICPLISNGNLIIKIINSLFILECHFSFVSKVDHEMRG